VATSNANLIVPNWSIPAANMCVNVLVRGTKKFNVQTKERLMFGHERLIRRTGHTSRKHGRQWSRTRRGQIRCAGAAGRFSWSSKCSVRHGWKCRSRNVLQRQCNCLESSAKVVSDGGTTESWILLAWKQRTTSFPQGALSIQCSGTTGQGKVVDNRLRRNVEILLQWYGVRELLLQ
jgi:hypothetical protein